MKWLIFGWDPIGIGIGIGMDEEEDVGVAEDGPGDEEGTMGTGTWTDCWDGIAGLLDCWIVYLLFVA